MNKFIPLVLILMAACHPQAKVRSSDEAVTLFPVFFEVDQSDIKNGEAIEKNARWLMANTDKVVVLEGHCDEKGDRQYNLWLGDRRARSVMAELMARGVGENQLIIVSYGKDRPAARGAGSAEKNRRVEFVVR